MDEREMGFIRSCCFGVLDLESLRLLHRIVHSDDYYVCHLPEWVHQFDTRLGKVVICPYPPI